MYCMILPAGHGRGREMYCILLLDKAVISAAVWCCFFLYLQVVTSLCSGSRVMQWNMMTADMLRGCVFYCLWKRVGTVNYDV